MRYYRNPWFWTVWLLVIAATSVCAYVVAAWTANSFPPISASDPAATSTTELVEIERSNVPVKDTVTPFKGEGRKLQPSATHPD